MSECDICCCLCIGLAHLCENNDNQHGDCCCPCCLTEMPDAYLAIPEPVNIINDAKYNATSKMR